MQKIRILEVIERLMPMRVVGIAVDEIKTLRVVRRRRPSSRPRKRAEHYRDKRDRIKDGQLKFSLLMASPRRVTTRLMNAGMSPARGRKDQSTSIRTLLARGVNQWRPDQLLSRLYDLFPPQRTARPTARRHLRFRRTTGGVTCAPAMAVSVGGRP